MTDIFLFTGQTVQLTIISKNHCCIISIYLHMIFIWNTLIATHTEHISLPFDVVNVEDADDVEDLEDVEDSKHSDSSSSSFSSIGVLGLNPYIHSA